MSFHGSTNRQIMASDPGSSAWVSASAGTGKTRVLTDRVLRLLLDGTSPGRILCLTFTRAAAAEMTNRLHRDLSHWAIREDADLCRALRELTGRAPVDDDLERARRLFARVLDAPGGFKIQTIHAFCESLLARFPLESGLPPHFSVIDERTSAELLDEARDRVLIRARTDAPLADSLHHLTSQVSEDRFGDMARQLTAERSRLERLLHRFDNSFSAVSAAIREALGLNADEDEAAIVTATCDLSDSFVEKLHHVADAMSRGGTTDRRHGALIGEWLDNPERRENLFPRYVSAFLTQQGTRRAKLIHKEASGKAPGDAGALLDREADRLEAAVARIGNARTVADTLAALYLGYGLFGAYEEVKQRQALLDYEDLIARAGRLLMCSEVAPWVHYKLDGGLDHVLIDEAQDTNDEQWQVVASLTEEFFAGMGARDVHRTIFAVGDAKQSIYGFQQADPHLFAQWRDHFGARVTGAGGTWQSLDLVHSYRSAPPILSLVDEVFAPPEVHDGLVFDDAEIDHVPHRMGQAGLVELWPAERPHGIAEPEPWDPPVRQVHDLTPGVRLSRTIAGRVGDWLRRGERLESRDRPVRPGDVMILVQRRAGIAGEIVHALKRADIPVAGTDRMILTEQLPVMDLVSLGWFSILPDDDLSLAETLKSPLFGFDDEALFDVAWERGPRSLWSALRDRQDRSPAYAAAVRTLGGILAAADHMPPYEFFARVLGPGEGRSKLLARLGPEANDPIDEFLALCLQFERLHAPSLQGFLQWVTAGDAEVKRDLEIGRDEVRVLTVHGAKGLQAPIVFLPDTCRVSRESSGIHWIRDETGRAAFPLWSTRRDREGDAARNARETARQRREQESRRLLYVALTRAEDRLYIGGFEGAQGRPSGCWYDTIDRAMREIGMPIEGPDGEKILTLRDEQSRPPDRADARAAPSHGDAPLPSWARVAAPPEPSPPTPLAPSRPEGAEPPVRSPIGPDSGARFRRGRLIHRLLELLPEIPAARRPAVARELLSNPLHGLEPCAREEIVDAALSVLEDPSFAPLFGPGSRAEVAIAGVEGARVVSGRIDRLLVTEDSVLVVDYKSDRPAPRTADDVAPAYLGQLAAYRGILERIYPMRTVRCALLWTDGPILMEVDRGDCPPRAG